MANNYVESSFAIDLLSEKEIEWWKKEGERVLIDDDIDIEDVEPAMSADWEFCGAREDAVAYIWFSHDESINVDSAAGVIQRFLKECRPNGSVGFCWAEICSNRRLDEFGGGGCFITAKNIEWENGYDWVRKQQAEFIKGQKEYPRINLSFSGWCRGAEVTEAFNMSGSGDAMIDLAGVSADELARKINEGVWAIALSECLGQSSKDEIEITDVEKSS